MSTAIGHLLLIQAGLIQIVSADPTHAVSNFEGPDFLKGWSLARTKSATGRLSIGPGHEHFGAVITYDFRARAGHQPGQIEARWKGSVQLWPDNSLAISFWVRSPSGVDVSLSVRASRREPLISQVALATLEHQLPNEWHHVVVPLWKPAAESRVGGPSRPLRIVGIGLLVKPHDSATGGQITIDEFRFMDTSSEPYHLSVDRSPGSNVAKLSALGTRWGVNIHLLQDPHALDLAQDAGFRFVRMDLLWANVERNGRYRFGAYDRLMRALELRGMSALWIIDYGHPEHGGERPRSREDLAAFARYAGAAAAHFKSHSVRYEVWNEPNNQQFWKPVPNPTQYADLLQVAVRAIHEADASALIATGGIARTDSSFVRSVLGSLPADLKINAIAFHPYRSAAPETLAADFQALRASVSGQLHQSTEFWDTEWGYSSTLPTAESAPSSETIDAMRRQQAVLAVRELLTIWALDLPVAVWYDLRDDGPDLTNPEQNYGLLDSTGNEKEALKVLRTLVRSAVAATHVSLMQDVPDGLHVLRLDNSADSLFIVWSDRPSGSWFVRFPIQFLVTSTDMSGVQVQPMFVDAQTGQFELKEGDGPIYLRWANYHDRN